MSSTIDPAKLKVVELRNELQERGLDTKGNKAALVQRLKEALEKETNTSLPNTSILETSTEDLDTTQNEDSQEPPAKQAKLSDEKMNVDSCPKPQTAPKTPEKPTAPATKTPEKPKVESPAKVTQSPAKPQERTTAVEEKKEVELAENGEQAETVKDAASGSQQSTEAKESSEKPSEETTTEQKGEKRKREGDSPERDTQKVRAKSPIKEDEPVINNDNVQLNWYDSDLHLEVDKANFLSAKPFTDGAFGYAWAGIRASHGVSKGKVCYEVKITEEIKWEDLTKIAERNRQDMRRNQKRDRDKKGRKPSDDKKSDKSAEDKDKAKAEDKDKGKAEEKKDSAENGDKENADAGKESTENKEESEKKDEEKTEKMDTTTEKEKPTEETPMETDAAATDDTKKSEDAGKKENDNKDGEKSESGNKEGEKSEAEKKEPEEQLPIHLIRVGWSILTSSLQLGEDKCSYAYESTGKFVNDKQFIDYGKTFAAGDVVGAYLSIDDEYVTIRYTVNGELQPVAATLQKSEFPEDFALFPHVLTRNCAFEINLGQKEEPWFASPDLLKEYVFLTQVDAKVSGPCRPETRAECEVILMCGLPGSGKTEWVKGHIGSNADKRYTVIGNASLLERMTVSGNPLRSKFKGKWSIFVDRLQKCLNALITLASQRRRNYIIDQTNVFPSAQRRKMRPFEGFKRKAVIVVVGDEEQSKRQALQESTDGKGVPDSVILEMKAAMSLPEKGEWMDEVIFAGLDEEGTKEQVKKYNEAGKAAGYGTEKRFRFKGERFQSRKPNFRGRGDRDRGFRDRRYDSRGGKWGPRGGGGGGWRDRQDRRGPPPSRDYRTGGRDYGGRDYGRRDSGGYNRNRNTDRWSGGGGGRSGGGYGGGGGGWNQQTFGSSGYSSWGGSQGGSGGGGGGGSQWKYGGGGQGYGGGGYGGGQSGSWNYYGQYGQNQNWNSHK